MKDKKGKAVLNGLLFFFEVVNESKRKPNRLWVDQERIFYNSPMQKCLDNNDILMYWTHIEDKLAVAERFTKRLKGKVYKKWQLMINLVLIIRIK